MTTCVYSTIRVTFRLFTCSYMYAEGRSHVIIWFYFHRSGGRGDSNPPQQHVGAGLLARQRRRLRQPVLPPDDARRIDRLHSGGCAARWRQLDRLDWPRLVCLSHTTQSRRSLMHVYTCALLWSRSTNWSLLIHLI